MRFTSAILSLILAAPLAVSAYSPVPPDEPLLLNWQLHKVGFAWVWINTLGYAISVQTTHNSMWTLERYDDASQQWNQVFMPVDSGTIIGGQTQQLQSNMVDMVNGKAKFSIQGECHCAETCGGGPARRGPTGSMER